MSLVDHETLEQEIYVLKNKIKYLRNKSSKNSKTSVFNYKYEEYFQEFLTNNIGRSNMAYLIYGVSMNSKEGLGYTEHLDKSNYPKLLCFYYLNEVIIKETIICSKHRKTRILL